MVPEGRSRKETNSDHFYCQQPTFPNCELSPRADSLTPADPVLRQLRDNMKTSTVPPKFSSDWRDGKFVTEAINACPGDAQLMIEAWDQS